MLRRSLLFVGITVLTGCASPLHVASITEIQSRTGSKSVDVYEPKRVSGQAAIPEFAGDQLLEVRTYVYKPETGEAEVAGATCTLTAADFSATTQSPAKIRVPLYRGQSSELAVACEMPDYQKKMVTVRPVDVTRQGRMVSGSGGGLIGLVAVTAIDGFADNTKNEWRYPLARVVLEPAKKP